MKRTCAACRNRGSMKCIDDAQCHSAADKPHWEINPKWAQMTPFGRFLCWLGWHKVTAYTGWNGCSFRAKCDRCGYEGLIDSQGNLF